MQYYLQNAFTEQSISGGDLLIKYIIHSICHWDIKLFNIIYKCFLLNINIHIRAFSS